MSVRRGRTARRPPAGAAVAALEVERRCAAARASRTWARRRHDWPPARRRRRLTISTPSASAAARIMSASGTAPAVSRDAPNGPAGAGPAIGRRSSPPDVSDRGHSTRYTRSEYCSSSKPVKRSGLWWARGLPPVEDRDRRGTTWRTGRRACGCRPWLPCVIRSPPPDQAWDLHTARGRAIDLHLWFT